MIDFWEAIGRMASDIDLAHKFIAILPPAGRVARQTVAGSEALDVPDEQYSNIQKFFAPILTQGVLSIMAAGELYWTFSFHSSREKMDELAAFLKQNAGPTDGASTGYFIGLGIIIIDKYLRENIQQDADKSPIGPPLSPTEKTRLTTLAQSPQFNEIALAFCRSPWAGGACNSTAMLWKGHLHPQAVAEKYAEAVAG